MNFGRHGEIKCRGVSIDSRCLRKGELFVALEGKKTDGHYFIDEAFKVGAAAAVVCRDKLAFSAKNSFSNIIPVVNTQKALEEIALLYRSKFNGPVTAVTGSNGKTTTKDMIARSLSGLGPVLKTMGTQNNKIGVPLTIFRLKKSHRIIVFELGASKRGEIDALRKITRPDYAVITNIGHSHLEFLKTKENVLGLKLELVRGEDKNRIKTVFLNFDDEYLRKAAESLSMKVVFFGRSRGCAYRAENISYGINGLEFTVNKKYKVVLKTIGEHNVYNALAAWAVARELKVPADIIQSRLRTFNFPANRLQLTKKKRLFIIDDTYNANPDSVKAALRALSAFRTAGRKTAVLADMLELGNLSEKLHYEIGFEAGSLGIDTIVAFGKFSKFTNEGALKSGVKNCINKESPEETLEWLLKNVKPQEAVLFKGSRCMRVEELIKCFINGYMN